MVERGIRRTLALLSLVAVLAAGCAYKASFNRKYLDDSPGAGVRIDGAAALFVEPRDEQYVFKGRPKSLTARGSTIEMPLGRMNREIALATLGPVFREGLRPAKGRDGAAGSHVIQTRIAGYEYRFNTLRNLTFKNTPQVRLAVEILVRDPSGRDVLSRTYDTGGWFNGKTVWDTLKPAELINRTTHLALAEIYARAAGDIRDAWRNEPARPAVSPAPAVHAPPAVPPAAGRDAAERLRELRSLKDQGLIDEETFRRKEQEILESL